MHGTTRTTLLFLLAIPLFVGSGCARVGQAKNDFYTYTVTISTSDTVHEARQAALQMQDTTLDFLLSQIGVDVSTQHRDQEVHVTALNGIIATLSNEWHVYINAEPAPYTDLSNIPIHSTDTIEWKYETTNN